MATTSSAAEPKTAPNAVYAFVAAFFEELERAGVRDVCLSPGSRSTPLALAAAARPGLRRWLHVDERAAGFFALGLARAARRPVALVCTSGTAAANYLPAVVEAFHSGIPLLLLTADRPPELRGWGAGQTIDQIGLYGRHARQFVEVPVPRAGAAALRHARSLACRAVSDATGRPPGPVHLNWPLREPLEPVPDPDASDWAEGDALAAEGRPGRAYAEVGRGVLVPAEDELSGLAELALSHARGVIACGPPIGLESEGLAAAVSHLSTATGWPILADVTSGLRRGPHCPGSPVVAHADLLLRDPGFAEAHVPELVLRIGGSPVSKAQRLWLEARPPAQWWLVDPDGGWQEPSHRASRVLRADPTRLCAALASRVGAARPQAPRSAWLRAFLEADARAGRDVNEAIAAEPELFEPRAAVELAERLPEGALLYVSNSMPVRDLDAFLHDVGGLLAARPHDLSLLIVVLNNDGGGIFSFLPIARYAAPRDFEALFTTPHGLDLAPAAALYGARFERVGDWCGYRDAIDRALSAGGVSIVEVPIAREANRAHFQALCARAGRAASA